MSNTSYIEEVGGFCRNDLFNATLSWNTNNPNLTQCMRDTLLTMVPAVLLIAMVPPWLIRCFYRRPTNDTRTFPRKLGFFFWSKLTLLLIMALNVPLELYTRSADHEDGLTHSEILGPCCLLVGYLTSVSLVIVEKMWRSHTSPPQFVYWLLLTFCAAPTLKIQVEALMDCIVWNKLILTVTFWPLVLIMLILHCFSDLDREMVPKESPEITGSFFSVIYFSWMNPLFNLGYSTPIQLEMLPNPAPWVDVHRNIFTFQRKWNSAISSVGVNFSKADKNRPKVSLWAVIVKTYGPRFLFVFCLIVAQQTVVLVSPYVLKLLVNHIRNGTEIWKGYFYATIMLVSSVVYSVVFQNQVLQKQIIALQMRSSIVGLLYRKALCLSNKARRNYTTGEITNHMSVDCQRIITSFWITTNMFAAPFVIIMAFYFIYLELGVAMWAGLGAMCILIPIQFTATKLGERFEKEQLVNKDARLKGMSEIINGIKVLKLYAWEKPFMQRITDTRAQEIAILKKSALIRAVISFSFNCSPVLTTLAILFTYVMIDPVNNVLTAEKIFVTIAYLNVLRIPMSFLPWSLMECIKLTVSINRLAKFLNSDEMDPHQILQEVKNEDNAMEISNCTFSWYESDEENTNQGFGPGKEENENLIDAHFLLKNINMNIPKGSLIAVVGVVGSGKSSLLSAMLGNLTKRSGQIGRVGNVAYVPQQAWIQNLSVIDNIIFEKEFNKRKYEHTLDACALRADLEILPAGDQTEIGEKGINLSGGQKQRVSLARAVYSEYDIYLLDDPLSAVDAHVGKHLFEQVIGGPDAILKGRTRVLVTHSVDYLEHMDQIFVMKEGQIAERGSYQDLLDSKGAFSEFLNHYKTKRNGDSSYEQKDKSIESKQRLLSNSSQTSDHVDVNYSRELQPNPPINPIITESTENINDDISDTGQLIKKEANMEGSVKLYHFTNYVYTLGMWTTIIIVLMFFIGIGARTFSNFTISVWADANDANKTMASGNTAKYLSIVSFLGLIECGLNFTRQLMLFLATASAAKIIHNKFLNSVMRSPMTFFDTHPSGRILNRFSSDIETIDQTIPMQLSDILQHTCELMYIVVVICYSTPLFTIILVPLIVIYYYTQKYYIVTTRQIKRLQFSSISPLFSHFSESIAGSTSIHAYNEYERFVLQSEKCLSENMKALYLSMCANRWLGTRIQSLGNLIVFFSAFFAIIAGDKISPGLAGLSIVYSLTTVDTLNWVIRMLCELQTNAVALERVKEYTDNKHEADWEIPEEDFNVTYDWPQNGCIKFEGYETRYRVGLDLVLKGIDLKINSSENIGICGRTGAGKSSLTLALFRLIEPTSGTIVIDGVDITKIGLHTLRSRLTIIPQDPVLFTGNLRFNLDPNLDFSDSDVWRALEHAHLKNYVTTLTNGLYYNISEGGENFSVGQRQLICLARALLRKTKILILDEATAAVDLETDDLIQSTIRKEFSDCSVITIAHRLNTIMDYCQIAVLSDGKLVEKGKPEELMNDQSSAFYSMATNAGI